MNYTELFEQGMPYHRFLETHGTEQHRQRWNAVYEAVRLTEAQQSLLGSFNRTTNVIVLAGSWRGDCVNQCPVFQRFSEATDCLQIRYFDRDAHPRLGEALSACGAARVPAVLFLSEDFHVCGRYGDRTLSTYRRMVSEVAGASCASGIVVEGDELLEQVTGEWLNEFERIQWMLRTSGRLRALHGD